MEIVGTVRAPYKLFLPPEMIPADTWEGALCYKVQDEYIGVAEFSAPKGCVILPEQLLYKLGKKIGTRVEMAPANLPKGTRVTLRAQDSLDWKHLLEQYLPQNYTTLQQGQEIEVEYNGTHTILVERCEPAEAICIIDTDLDLELDAPPPEAPASVGYGTWPLALASTLISKPGVIYVEGVAFLGPEHATSLDSYLERVNGEYCIEEPMAICGYGSVEVRGAAGAAGAAAVGAAGAHTDDTCPTCNKAIPPQSMVLHQAFCARNTIKCSCGQAFTQAIPRNHWHCSCGHAETSDFKALHTREHEQATCACGYKDIFAKVARHRASVCPLRLHICQFCHLLLPQGEETPVNRIQGYSEHEAACGTKTTNCPQCAKVVMVRALAAHLLHHEQVRLARASQSPTLCTNQNCPNLVAAPGAEAEAAQAQARLGLCSACYGVVHVQQHDPDLSKLRARLERRYMIQLTRGCGNTWCANPQCASGSLHALKFKEAELRAQQLMAQETWHLCVDRNASRKHLFLEEEPDYSRAWKGMAISLEGSEPEARAWLRKNAPRVDGT